MNYAIVCEECRDTVLKVAYIGDPEADALAAHLKQEHREESDSTTRRGFADILKRFRLKMAE